MQHVVPKIVTLMGIFDRIKDHTNVKLLVSELRQKDIKEPSRKMSEYEQSFFDKIEKMVDDLDVFYEDFLFFSNTMLDARYKEAAEKHINYADDHAACNPGYERDTFLGAPQERKK